MMNPIVQLHARARRLHRELELCGIHPQVRDGSLVLVGHRDQLSPELQDEVDLNYLELAEYVLAMPRRESA